MWKKSVLCLLVYGCVPRTEEPVSPATTAAPAPAPVPVASVMIANSAASSEAVEPPNAADSQACASVAACEELLRGLVSKREACTKHEGADCFAEFNRERRVQYVLLPEARQRESGGKRQSAPDDQLLSPLLRILPRPR